MNTVPFEVLETGDVEILTTDLMYPNFGPIAVVNIATTTKWVSGQYAYHDESRVPLILLYEFNIGSGDPTRISFPAYKGWDVIAAGVGRAEKHCVTIVFVGKGTHEQS